MLATLLAAADGTEPAGGAAIGEVILATGGAMVATTVLLVLGMGHRSGKVKLLGNLAAFSERVSGLPGWAALPVGLATGSLLTAVFGMYWDISLHIDQGRDEGPLANMAHYFILFGLFGIFAAGFLAMVLPKEKPGPTAIRVQEDWYVPLGGVLVAACGAFSLIGFPLDDVWHRLFGQDVTLWGPTHLMLIGGASMTLIGLSVLLIEGQRANAAAGEPDREKSWAAFARRMALPGGLLIGMSTFQAEFDFSVPQFRFVFHPMLIMLAAGVTLVATRMYLGRGAALLAVAFFLVVRGTLTLLVGPVLGETTPALPLYVVEALIVEAVALRYANRPLQFGLLSGLGIGTLGLAGEWGWTHLVMHQPWPSSLFPEALLLGLPMALVGAVIGAWVGSRLCADTIERPAVLRPLAVVAAAALAVMVVYALQDSPKGDPVRAQVQVEDVGAGGAQREGVVTVTLEPRDAAEDAEWLTVTAWQGGGSMVEPLEEVGPGQYRTPEPVPLHGTWKSLIRLHTGSELQIMPIFLPRDPAIPAPEVPAPASFSREFVAEPEILLREQDGGGASWAIAYAVVAAIALALLVLIAWGLHRLAAFARPQSPSRTGEVRTGMRVRPTPAAS